MPSKLIVNQNRIYTPDPANPSPTSTIHLSIHGACLRNGQPGARASYGIYFPPPGRSSWNTSGLLPHTASHKSQNAQLYACQRALEHIEDVVSKAGHVGEVVIKTHSQYLVRCFTEFVDVWKVNGWENVKGTSVINRVGIERVEGMIEDAEKEGGLKVRFWLVKKEDNLDVVPLADEVFKRPVEEPSPPTPTAQPWESALKHWFTAYASPEARHLCLRLNITLRKLTRSTFTGFTAVLRRLVITGEDRPVNFERIFGPNWAPAISDEWKTIRADVLHPKKDKEVMYAMLDAGTPFYRPRPPTKAELGAEEAQKEQAEPCETKNANTAEITASRRRDQEVSEIRQSSFERPKKSAATDGKGAIHDYNHQISMLEERKAWLAKKRQEQENADTGGARLDLSEELEVLTLDDADGFVHVEV